MTDRGQDDFDQAHGVDSAWLADDEDDARCEACQVQACGLCVAGSNGACCCLAALEGP